MNNFLNIITENLIPLSIVFGSFLVIGLVALLFRPYQDDKKCEAIIKENSKTFYKAFSAVKNRHKRKAIFAVYAFCRLADDLVDESSDEQKLNVLLKELDDYVKKHKTPTFIWRSLKRHTKVYYQGFDYQPFYDMIKGQEMDLEFKGYETIDDLLKYCYHVASTVGLMLTPILAFESKDKLTDFSIKLGYAMQLTNILRDVGEDYRNDRIYLPRVLMKEANYKHEDLASGKINDRFVVVFEKLAKIAENYYDESLQSIGFFPDDARLPLAYAIILYRGILDQIRENGYDVFKKRAVLSNQRKKALIEQYLKSINK